MASELHRLFFALWPDDALREQLSRTATQLRMREDPRGRWLAAARYHLTLVFVGDFPRALPAKLAENLIESAGRLRAQPFELRIDRAGSFRNREIPWWLGPSVEPPELRQLWQRLREQLRADRQPFDVNLRMTPHLTLLRNAGRALPLTPVPALVWPVTEFVLIHSSFGATAEYRLLGRWDLDADAPPAAEPPPAQLDLWEH